MSNDTSIEWTDSTWNPTTGCTKVSRGCDHCYAERIANRLFSSTYSRRLPVVDSSVNRDDPFAVRIWPDRLVVPRRWRSPRRVFVNSMSDLFHQDIPELFVRQCFEVMLDVDRHVYQILTKRPSRAAKFVERNADLFKDGAIPEHIWIGTSVEDQAVDYRIRHLLGVSAKVRFLSCEPLIGSLELRPSLPATLSASSRVHWVIVGGESGPKARKLDPQWVRALRDECAESGIPFFFKQWGGLTPKAGGRELDGETWDEYPLPPIASM